MGYKKQGDTSQNPSWISQALVKTEQSRKPATRKQEVGHIVLPVSDPLRGRRFGSQLVIRRYLQFQGI